MQAVVIREFGDVGKLKVEEVATPEVHGDEVLVEVRAAGINPSDVKNVAGGMHGTTLPRIPGRDFAGVVVKGAKDLVGKEVWGTGGDIGFTRDGSHAKYILLPGAAVAMKPAGLSMEEAGSAGLTFVTAWSAITGAELREKETIVVIGAAGGVGLAAVQIARRRGARVIGAVQKDEDIAAAREAGAAEAINTRSSNLIEKVGAMTDGRGADVVFDTSGRMFAEAVEVAGRNGRIPVITAPPDGKAAFNLRDLYRKTLRVVGIDTRQMDAVASGKILGEMTTGFESGAYRVKAGKAMPLSEAIEAYREAGGGGGRILLRPDL